MNDSIGGVLRWDWLAQKHRPSDDETMSAEVRRLHASGLTPQDIYVALRLPLEQVREWLGASR